MKVPTVQQTQQYLAEPRGWAEHSPVAGTAPQRKSRSSRTILTELSTPRTTDLFSCATRSPTIWTVLDGEAAGGRGAAPRVQRPDAGQVAGIPCACGTISTRPSHLY